MYFREIIRACNDYHTEDIDTVHGQDRQWLDARVDGMYS
jgi:hypothetical protein